MTRHVLVVLSNAAEGCEDEYNDWYDHQHLGDVLAVDGFVAAQRFRLSDAQLRPDEPMPYGYLAVYEIEADDLNTPLQGLISGIASGAIPLSESLDLQRLSTYTFTPIADRVTA